MWFSEKALVFVDTRTAAIAVYRNTFSGPRLLRFGFERFVPSASQAPRFSEAALDAKESLARLIQGLSAPLRDACVVLPLGAAFPSVLDLPSLRSAEGADVADADLVRFRLAPLLPFPVAQAEVRMEAFPSFGRGAVLAQAILKSTIAETEKVMTALGFGPVHVSSTLSSALRGLSPGKGGIDLILGDSASAIAVRDDRGEVHAIHLRLLAEGDDRARRSIAEAIRAAPEKREIRVLGEDAAAVRGQTDEALITGAFTGRPHAGADPQLFPFLDVFYEGQFL